MKALQLIIAGIAIYFAGTAAAQVSVSVNIGSPPPWGPAGYANVRYYYLPDLETYYDIHSSVYIYSSRGRWIHSRYLPSRFRNYDLYGGYKVVMTDYHGNAPYTYFNEYKSKYARGYRGQPQGNIGERPGNGNGRGNAYGNGNGKGNGYGKGNGNGKGHGNGNGKGNGNGNGNGNGKGKNK